MALAKHKLTGNIVDVPAHYIGHPSLGKNLVALDVEVQAAPKKENKKKPAEYVPAAVDADGDGIVQDGTIWERPVGTEIEEQPAPENNIEENDEELEDGN